MVCVTGIFAGTYSQSLVDRLDTLDRYDAIEANTTHTALTDSKGHECQFKTVPYDDHRSTYSENCHADFSAEDAGIVENCRLSDISASEDRGAVTLRCDVGPRYAERILSDK